MQVRKKGVLLHPQSGSAVLLKSGTEGNGSSALYIAAEVSRNGPRE